MQSPSKVFRTQNETKSACVMNWDVKSSELIRLSKTKCEVFVTVLPAKRQEKSFSDLFWC